MKIKVRQQIILDKVSQNKFLKTQKKKKLINK